MSKTSALDICLIFANVCAAQERELEPFSCVPQERESGTDAQSKKTQEVLCQEYVLQTDKLFLSQTV